MKLPLPLPLAICACLPALALGQNKVWVVSSAPGPGVDFTQIQPAVDAAQSGDLILVKPGTYGGVDIGAKRLSLAADGPGVILVSGPATPALRIHDIPVGSAVRIQGLRCKPGAHSSATLSLQDSPGVIALEDCELIGHNSAQSCSAVLLHACDLQGLGGTDTFGMFAPAGMGFAGLNASASTLALSACQIEGGIGGFAWLSISCGFDGDGGDGLRAVQSVLYVQDSSVIGGASYLNAGNGLELTNQSQAVLVNAICTGGLGLVSGFPTCSGLSGGSIIASQDSSWSQIAAAPHDLSGSGLLREGQAGSLHFSGAPGEFAFLLLSTGADYASLPSVLGPLSLALPLEVVPVGALPPQGFVDLPFSVQDLGPGVEFTALRAQSAYVDPVQQALVLGPGKPIVLLDSAF